MEQAGSKRIVGLALLGSAVVMIVLAAFIWSGLLPVTGDSRTYVVAALLVAAMVDLAVGTRFVTAAGSQEQGQD
jgi:hypothetical protein